MAIGAAVVGNQVDVGRALTIATAAATDGLDKLIRACCRRQDQRNLRGLREALIQFGPTRYLLVG